ncbi:hypothetical protein [Spartinivicinus ruber]|uniref:hypothetical protein n=1 Tax=Spartinivicinus ruber TaxID=2683272 RepID=UPI0013D581B9|nr:hypothetical protein [Spartinivicinus ruber]
MNKLFQLKSDDTFMLNQYSNWYSRVLLTDSPTSKLYVNISDLLSYTSEFINGAFLRVPKATSERLKIISLNRIIENLNNIANYSGLYSCFIEGFFQEEKDDAFEHLSGELFVWSSDNGEINARMLIGGYEYTPVLTYKNLDSYINDIKFLRKSIVHNIVSCVRNEIKLEKRTKGEYMEYYKKGISMHRNLLLESQDFDIQDRYAVTIDQSFWSWTK